MEITKAKFRWRLRLKELTALLTSLGIHKPQQAEPVFGLDLPTNFI
jgi:hypothetical protein